MNKIKVMSVFGTRPEAIKMAPLVKLLEQEERMESIVCVTAQHREMLDQVLEIFDIHPQYDLNIMQSRQTLAGITTRALTGLSQVMEQEKPDIVLVHGDTSTTFAGALAAYYNQIQVGHVEAGLRTYDKYQPFPEEMNRRLTGALADLHFAPTVLAKKQLLKENVENTGIFITGNTVIDALAHTIEEDYTFHAEELNAIDFKGKKVIAMTAHRRENLGQPLVNICKGVKRIVEEFPQVEVVYAVHKNPVVQETAQSILGGHPRIHLTPPLDLKDMHNLMCRSYLVMTDSGGLQEEVPSMGKPVLVLRHVTERPEGVEAGTLKLAGTEEETIYTMAKELLTDESAYAKMAQAKNPFGDGKASERIVQAILYAFEKEENRPADYAVAEKKNQKGGNDMKEERMAILGMLEKGLITAAEAERLLLALKKEADAPDGGISKAVGGALEKAGAVLGDVAKTVGEKAEMLHPRMRSAASKLADKADEMQPAVRSAMFRMTERANELKEDAKFYRDKLKEKRMRNQGEDWDEADIDEMDMAEEAAQDVPVEAEEVKEAETAETAETEALDPAMEKYVKRVETVMDSVQSQMEQINECEDFLKAAFGDVDWSEFDDEDEENAEKKEEAKEEKEEKEEKE